MKILTLPLAAALVLSSQLAQAEVHPGAELFEAGNCISCHTAKPFDPKKTVSFPKLVKAVQFCNDNLNTGMFEDEVEQLADYLNETYYHHPK